MALAPVKILIVTTMAAAAVMITAAIAAMAMLIMQVLPAGHLRSVAEQLPVGETAEENESVELHRLLPHHRGCRLGQPLGLLQEARILRERRGQGVCASVCCWLSGRRTNVDALCVVRVVHVVASR